MTCQNSARKIGQNINGNYAPFTIKHKMEVRSLAIQTSAICQNTKCYHCVHLCQPSVKTWTVAITNNCKTQLVIARLNNHQLKTPKNKIREGCILVPVFKIFLILYTMLIISLRHYPCDILFISRYLIINILLIYLYAFISTDPHNIHLHRSSQHTPPPILTTYTSTKPTTLNSSRKYNTRHGKCTSAAVRFFGQVSRLSITL